MLLYFVRLSFTFWLNGRHLYKWSVKKLRKPWFRPAHNYSYLHSLEQNSIRHPSLIFKLVLCVWMLQMKSKREKSLNWAKCVYIHSVPKNIHMNITVLLHRNKQKCNVSWQICFVYSPTITFIIYIRSI